PVVIGTPLSAGNPQPIAAGSDQVALPVFITGEGTALTALRDLSDNPSQFYLNIHTADFPNGIMRGQLRQAIGTLNLALMDSDNEVPSPGVRASGQGTAFAIGTLDEKGVLETGEVYLFTTYKIADGGTLSGFHIHPGVAGSTGPVVLNSGLPAGIPVDPAGGF